MSLPDPMAVPGAVVLDIATRTATVVPTEAGFPTMLWRQGIEKMVKSEAAGIRGSAPTVWAHGLGHKQIGHGQPAGGALKFTFRKGDAAWPDLVGTAGLSAIITVDRRTSSILGVRFRGKKG